MFVNHVHIRLAVDFVNDAAATLEEFELRHHIGFRPCKTAANRLLRIVVAAARHQALHRSVVVDNEIDHLQIIALEEFHRVVEGTRLIFAARKTIGNDMFLACEGIDDLFCLQIDRHEIRHAHARIDNLARELAGVGAAVAQITQFLSHVDADTASIALRLYKVDKHVDLRPLTRALGSEKQYCFGIHIWPSICGFYRSRHAPNAASSIAVTLSRSLYFVLMKISKFSGSVGLTP